MKPQIRNGRCSSCREAAERGPSGAWWHTGGVGCGGRDARFVPDVPARRQQQPPRNRQIPHPPEDR